MRIFLLGIPQELIDKKKEEMKNRDDSVRSNLKRLAEGSDTYTRRQISSRSPSPRETRDRSPRDRSPRDRSPRDRDRSSRDRGRGGRQRSRSRDRRQRSPRDRRDRSRDKRSRSKDKKQSPPPADEGNENFINRGNEGSIQSSLTLTGMTCESKKNAHL